MLLTVSKRLEFSASRRLNVAGWTDNENLAVFGSETNARYGSGRNYIAYFVFTGPVDPATGMLINISEIKERAGEVLKPEQSVISRDFADCRERCPSALLRCRVAVFGRGSKTVRLSLERVTRAERDLLFHRRLRSELLV